jgi:hypothetical protein
LVCSTTIGTKLFMYGSNRSDMGADLLVSVTQMGAARNSVKLPLLTAPRMSALGGSTNACHPLFAA